MITILYNHARVLNQKCGNECAVPEPDIAASLDANSLIILSQGGDEIIINPESVPELCRMLRQLKIIAEVQA